MIGKVSASAVILQLIFASSVIVDTNKANGLTITNPVMIGNCSASIPLEVLMPCLEMANQLTASLNITVRTVLNHQSLEMRKAVGRLFKDLISLATVVVTLNLNLLGIFGPLCQSFSVIQACMANSVATCPFPKSEPNRETVGAEIINVQNRVPLNATCSLNVTSIEGCIKQIPDHFKSEVVKVVQQIGESTVNQSVLVSYPGITGGMARSICRKSNEVIQLFKRAATCGATQCNDRAIRDFFWEVMLPLLYTPGCNATEESSTTKELTISFIGLGHISNTQIGSNFETCIVSSGTITLVDSNNFFITGLIVKRTNSTGHEYSYMTQMSIYLFGSKTNCGGVNNTPVKTIFFGKDVSAPQTGTTVCGGDKKITVTKLETKQTGSSRFRVIDECANINLILRYVKVATLNEVIYFTLRLPKSTKVAGELFSGCATQISVPGVAGNSRRKKRETSSVYLPLAIYDYYVTKNKEMETAMLETDVDVRALIPVTTESGGYGSKLAATSMSFVIAVVVLALKQ